MGKNMQSQTDVTYEVIDIETDESFFTEDRYIAEHHYADGYTVYEKHRTITRVSPFALAYQYVLLRWHDEDSETETEEV